MPSRRDTRTGTTAVIDAVGFAVRAFNVSPIITDGSFHILEFVKEAVLVLFAKVGVYSILSRNGHLELASRMSVIRRAIYATGLALPIVKVIGIGCTWFRIKSQRDYGATIYANITIGRPILT
jgi:hypothetical protein